MHHVPDMIRKSPHAPASGADERARCIEACFDCTQSCLACADACLSEEHVDMLARCIRLDQDCAAICATTGALLSRNQPADPDVLRAQLELCALVCERCAVECERHQDMHEHCRICAQVCRACEQACRAMLGSSPRTAARA